MIINSNILNFVLAIQFYLRMKICIINKLGSKIKLESSVGVIWIASLISESVFATGEVAYTLSLFHFWDYLNDKIKYNWTISIMKKNPKISNEYIESYIELYEATRKCRPIKHKDKKLFQSMQVCESLIRKANAYTKNHLNNLAVDNKYRELSSIAEYNIDTSSNPLVVSAMDEPEDEKQMERKIKRIVAFINKSDNITFTNHLILEDAQGVEMNTLNTNLTHTPSFIFDLVVELPGPELMNSTQLGIVRNDFSQVFWPYFNKIELWKTELKDIKYSHENIINMMDTYREKISALHPTLQKAIDENEIMSQLKDENESKSAYKVYFGITSKSYLLSHYLQMEALEENVMLYVKEEISKETDINNACPFLFMTKII